MKMAELQAITQAISQRPPKLYHYSTVKETVIKGAEDWMGCLRIKVYKCNCQAHERQLKATK